MFQSLQQQQLQQQQQQQQLPLQYTMGQNPFGIQTHIGLTPQMLNQAQQLQQHSEQQQQLLRRLMTQQNVLPSPSLPMSMSLSAPFLTGHQCQLANNNFLQNQVQLQSNPSMLGVLSSLQHQPNSSAGISNVPQGAQQAYQLQRSLMLQQNQLLASSLGAPSNNQLQCQQQQLPPLQAQAAQLQRNLQGSHSTVDPLPASRCIASSSSREEVSEK